MTVEEPREGPRAEEPVVEEPVVQEPIIEEPTFEEEVRSRTEAEEAWRNVGNQFEALGQSLADTFRSMWESEENRQHAREMRDGLKHLVNDVARAINEAAEAEGGTVRTEAKQAAESTGRAVKVTWQDLEPQLAAALERVNDELEGLISRLRSRPATEESTVDLEEPPVEVPEEEC
jgi:hypothetical protein